MARYTRIPENAFQNLQLNAGILLANFDPETGEVDEKDILGATSGGVNFTATPTYSDFAEDVDNAPTGMMEFMHLDTWEVSMSGTFITVDAAGAVRLIGPAGIDPQNPNRVVPRSDLKASDFKDLWWVGDYSDKNGNTNGGFAAIKMYNSLSTGGFQVQSGNREKGQFAFEFRGHYTIENQSKVPFEFYAVKGMEEPSDAAEVPGQTETYLGKKISDFVTEGTSILADGAVVGTLKYVSDFTEFNGSEPEEQKGNYMPVKLKITGKKMTLKKNGTAGPDKQNMDFDPELLFRVGEKTDTFTVEVDGREIITLNFANAELKAE